jgi:hypothetical protein
MNKSFELTAQEKSTETEQSSKRTGKRHTTPNKTGNRHEKAAKSTNRQATATKKPQGAEKRHRKTTTETRQ